MNKHDLMTLVLFALILVGGVLSVMVNAQEADNCSIIAEDLNSRIDQLKDRVSELNIAHQKRDSRAVQAALDQLSEIVLEIRLLQGSLTDCTQEPKKSDSVLAPVKSHEGELATLSCDDLRRRHVQISRRLNSLRRQLESASADTNSGLTRDYEVSEKALKSLETELRSRCLSRQKTDSTPREWWLGPPSRSR